MDIFNSYADMLARLPEVGWQEEKTEMGKTYYLDPKEGNGTLIWR